ncbi:glycosyltransferase 87 family protein [Corynebacterium sp. ES2794-CONJ1]|uniref:glycosyltransferase 87 family protein n=1 Tax=unclassified Corynebacterium TaxID=2624378 RepID=UPI0021670EF1|nr:MULTISPECIES: glycosyltransferase 87 family protein [unclassified Corynebacterium]MCS4490630.1 glycosyltransferase 87 family protein [Corynebacterium sp. ES2775-CONJ]MCU9520000.1 glycosyltransferase 87 family protein [Corynebacterium sp. ES2794-CONJ1]
MPSPPVRPRIPGIATLIALSFIAAWRVLSVNLSAENMTYYVNLFQIPVDFRVYYLAGQALREGQDLYAGNLVLDLPFTYPPFAGALFARLAAFPELSTLVVWQFFSAAALVAVVIAVFQERGYRLDFPTGILVALISIAFFALAPIRSTFLFGQINIFLMLLVSTDFLRRSSLLGGAGVGLAAGVKLTPAFFGLVFLMQKRWWAALTSIAVFGFTVLIGYLLVPDAHIFWTWAIFDSSRVGDLNNPGAQSLRGMLLRAFGVEGGALLVVLTAIVLAVVIAGMWAAIQLDNRSLALGIAGYGATLVSPFSWQHHWVWVVPMVLSILDALWRLTMRLSARIANRWVRELSEQCAAFCSAALVALMVLPMVSTVQWTELAYFEAGLSPLWWMRALYIGSALLTVLLAAIVAVVCVWRRRKEMSC